jgi:hypothetical protein
VDINIYKFSDRVLIIDRSNDEFIRAKTIAALEKHGFLSRVFDLLHKIPTNEYYINLFRYHAGIKTLANLLIPKPRKILKTATLSLVRIDYLRDLTYHFLNAANTVYKPISSELLINLLTNDDALRQVYAQAHKRKVISNSDGFLHDQEAKQTLVKAIMRTKQDKLFDQTHDGDFILNEMDLSLFVHCDVPVFLYSPDNQNMSELTDSLLKNYLRSALKVDRYQLEDDDKDGLDRLVNEIKSFTNSPIKHNSVAMPSSLHSFMN